MRIHGFRKAKKPPAYIGMLQDFGQITMQWACESVHADIELPLPQSVSFFQRNRHAIAVQYKSHRIHLYANRIKEAASQLIFILMKQMDRNLIFVPVIKIKFSQNFNSTHETWMFEACRPSGPCVTSNLIL
jgi:hypothetical protein